MATVKVRLHACDLPHNSRGYAIKHVISFSALPYDHMARVFFGGAGRAIHHICETHLYQKNHKGNI